MIERDVREMLHRRAGDVPPGTRAWERVAERIATGEPSRSRRAVCSRAGELVDPSC